jgi:hypothetical protein
VVAEAAPELVAMEGVGTETAASLLSPGCYIPHTPVNKPSNVPRALARGIILDGGAQAKRARSENASGAERGWCS